MSTPAAFRVAQPFEHEIDKVSGSRFLTTLIPARHADIAVETQQALRDAHPHSRHVCFAFVGEHPQDIRFSDDGEPSKTAGYPMLKVLLGASIRQTVALVTRYFGGVKLGTGGLVRAYTAAVREALLRCPLQPVVPTIRIRLRCAFSREPKFRHTLAQLSGSIDSVAYPTDAPGFLELEAELPESAYEQLAAGFGTEQGEVLSLRR